ncbi:MAG: biotin--[acetyl-CoA-carboxylase] ligase [Chitinophagaceae bacterium]|nr:MAG: biotin--[acetyl-CoA-carboxylase] ligase [Chitinophagaceae bacterium]
MFEAFVSRAGAFLRVANTSNGSKYLFSFYFQIIDERFNVVKEVLSLLKNKLKLTSSFLIGNPFLELQQVESTNNYATGAVHEGMAQHGMAVFAHHQTKGKGQHNKTWISDAGKNIAMSVVLQPPGLSLSQSFLISMATAVAVNSFFATYAGSETKVKWPNDLYWRDRKAGGGRTDCTTCYRRTFRCRRSGMAYLIFWNFSS